MSRLTRCFLAAALLLAVTASPPLRAANRIFIQDQTLRVGDTGMTVPVRADTDQQRNGFSLSVKYDPTKLKVNAVEIAGTASDGAGWSNGRIMSDLGAISWAVIPPLTDPVDINRVIPAGTNLVLVNLRVDVLATAPGTTPVTPKDGLSTPPGGWVNVFSSSGANTKPTLVGGTITIEEKAPQGNRYLLGDCNGDKGKSPDLSDAVFLLNYLFLGGATPGCMAACNSDSSAALDLTDGVFLLNYLFLSGPSPQAPYPACATGPAADCAADTCGV